MPEQESKPRSQNIFYGFKHYRLTCILKAVDWCHSHLWSYGSQFHSCFAKRLETEESSKVICPPWFWNGQICKILLFYVEVIVLQVYNCEKSGWCMYCTVTLRPVQCKTAQLSEVLGSIFFSLFWPVAVMIQISVTSDTNRINCTVI